MVLYPLAIGIGHKQLEPRFLAGLLVLAGLLRLPTLNVGATLHFWLAGTLLLLAAAVWTNQILPLKLYPVLVNAVMFAVFAYSLFVPPSMAERFARMAGEEVTAPVIRYTRRVTQVWCVFFIVNGVTAFCTALWAPRTVWVLYNGLIAYLLMGLLFVGEYGVRIRFKRRLYG